MRILQLILTVACLLGAGERAAAQEPSFGVSDCVERGYFLLDAYRAETGPVDRYRDYFLFADEGPFRVLHYMPSKESSEWLTEMSGGTGIGYRLLLPASRSETSRDSSYLYRIIQGVEHGERKVSILIVDMTVYWPEWVCSDEVARWVKLIVE